MRRQISFEVRGTLSLPMGSEALKLEANDLLNTELETLAATQRKVIRHTSEFEGDWLVALVAKYGDDVDKMTRDRKANVWQKTAGEIKRA
jgi:nucleolar protein 16